MKPEMFRPSTLAVCIAAGLVLAAPLSVSAAGLPAKNVILMISDGASWGTWDMASYWEYGAKGQQPYDSFGVKLGMTTFPLNTSNTPTNTGIPQISYDPVKAWDTTPNADSYGGRPNHFNGYHYIKQDYTDSAAAGTALATGEKTYNNAIDYDDFGAPLGFITQDAKALGKATGVISSVPFTHATPATFGAQNISRNNYHAIAEQMIGDGTLDLIMGGGNPLYDGSGQTRATPAYGWLSEASWNALNDGTAGMTLIQTKAEFEAMADGSAIPTGRVIGLPQVYDTLQYSRNVAVVGDDVDNPSGVAYIDSVPTLETMTKAALNHLGQDSDGLFLMVEGGAVDWAAHANATGRIIEEQIDFNRSVAAAVDWVESSSSWEETLMIVLTDHGNAMPMGPDSDTIAFQPIENNGQGVLPGVKWHYGTHTNENTLFFAHGAGADLFFDYVLGVDEGLRDILGFNDGRYIDNVHVYSVMHAAMQPAPIPLPASVLLLGTALLPLVARARRKAA